MEYADEEIVQNLCSNAGDTITLYAVWSFIVRIDSDNGSPIIEEVVIASGRATEPATPEKLFPSESALYEGTVIIFSYTFEGWYKDDVIWNFDNPITEPVTIKARWIFGGGSSAVDLSGINGVTIVDKAINYVNANPNACEYTLLIAQDISIDGDNSRGLNQSNARLTIIGAGERKLSLSSRGRMFTAGASGQTGIKLTLGENVKLVGLTYGQNGATQNNYDSVVYVQNGAALTMQGNSKVSGNGSCGVVVINSIFTMQDNATVSGNSEGGVYVYGYDGSFTMHDYASISGNTAREGGGVFIIYYGTLTMHDNASISGNTSEYSIGGGVYGGAFISGGTVYGNDAGPELSNTANSGAAIRGGGLYGHWDGTAWNGLTDIPLPGGNYRDETIKVVDGVLVPYP